MAFEVEAIETGRRMGLHISDWKNLLDLAHQYGWRPRADLGHRLHEPPQIISSSDARALAETLEVALKDLPAERRKELRPTDTVGTFVGEAVRDGPDPDSKSYLSWKRRWIVVEFIALC